METSREQVDVEIDRLIQQKERWLDVSPAARITYLQDCRDRVLAVAEQWVALGCAAKAIDPASPLAGEEWSTGPVSTLWALRQWVKTLQAQGQPRPVALMARGDGQQVAQVFPDTLVDKLLWLGITGEVWIRPGQPASQGVVYRQKPAHGRVALVLGAGNVSSIAPLDSLYKLIAEDQVVLLKLNPVNDYLAPILTQALHPLIADGFLAIVGGGSDLGHYLCHHDAIATIHITGSHQTHDAIIWGSTPTEQAQRRATHTPLLTKPITSELGNITPILVVPGQWSPRDLAFQARHVASMVTHNASFNCVAGKVIVTAKHWPQRQAFLAQLRRALAETPPRKAYYPGAVDRYQVFLDQYPQAEVLGDPSVEVPWIMIPDVSPLAGEYAFNHEAFCGIVAETSLEATDPGEFLLAATQFVNTSLWGNLSCVIIMDAATQQRYQRHRDQAIASLRYGVIGLNIWTGTAYLIAALPWGAFPGNPLDDVVSGRGVVHNGYLFDHPQKTVVYAPFRIRPKPAWFPDHKTASALMQQLAQFLSNPKLTTLGKLIWLGLRG